LAVEIVSDSDAPQTPWATKLARYHAVGIQELVRFDPAAPPGERLQLWDRLDGDLLERVVENDIAESRLLGLYWVVCPAIGFDAALRLSKDAEGNELLPTSQEAEAQARQAEAQARQAEAQARQVEAQARRAAEQRLAELEELLRKRG
jgi:hypothetical protein